MDWRWGFSGAEHTFEGGGLDTLRDESHCKVFYVLGASEDMEDEIQLAEPTAKIPICVDGRCDTGFLTARRNSALYEYCVTRAYSHVTPLKYLDEGYFVKKYITSHHSEMLLYL